VLQAFADIARAHGLDWNALWPRLLESARIHIETY
jgi:hypothetical protein